jgi:YVTN family beta-propeller protein
MRKLAFLLMTGLAVVTPASAQQLCFPPPSGIVAWWPGEGNANDIIGGNNGTLEAGVTFAPGEVGQAFRFNGIEGGGGVNLGNVPAFDFTPSTSFTIEAWVNSFAASVPPAGQAIVTLNYNCSNTLQQLAIQTGTERAYFQVRDADGVSAGALFSPTALSKNTFHHVAGVRQVVGLTKTVSLYVDGVLVATAADPTTGALAINTPDTIGRINVCGTTSTFNGLIDEVSIYNRALTSAEIAAIFAAGSAGKCQPGTARAAYVANAGSNSISVINPTTNTVVATVPVGANPVRTAVTPNGDRAYVTNAGSNSVSVINTTTNAVVATVPVGANPVDIAITPGGAGAYVTNAGANSVSVINTVTNTVLATVTVGLNPVNVAITPDGASAYVTNAGSNSVSVINTATNTVVATVPVGLIPVNVAIH